MKEEVVLNEGWELNSGAADFYKWEQDRIEICAPNIMELLVKLKQGIYKELNFKGEEFTFTIKANK